MGIVSQTISLAVRLPKVISKQIALQKTLQQTKRGMFRKRTFQGDEWEPLARGPMVATSPANRANKEEPISPPSFRSP